MEGDDLRLAVGLVSARWEGTVRSGTTSSGLILTLTRKGVEFWGFYDTFVGIAGGSLTWEEFDQLRADVLAGRAR